MNRRTFLVAFVAAAAMSTRAAIAVPAFPGKLVIVKNIGENRALFRLDPNSGEQIRLTAQTRQEGPPSPRGWGNEDGPCVSPDGKTLLFAAFSPGSHNWTTWKLDLATGEGRVLVEKDSWPVCWLPDGRFIGNLKMELWIFDSTGRPLKAIAHPDCMPVSGALTPQGELVYGDAEEPVHLRVLNLRTGASRRLTQGHSPIIAEHGRSVLFQSDRAYYRIPLAGGKREPLRALPKDASNLCASPDGKFLVWSLGSGTATRLVIATPDLRPVKTIPLDCGINALTWGA